MKVCPQMKEAIEDMARKHNVNLHEVGAHFRLDMPGYDRLCVENIGRNRISVAHYYELNGDLVAEPDIVFFADADDNWAPVEITQSLTGWSQYAAISDDEARVTHINRDGQRDLAEFAEDWAVNIVEQGWLEQGVRHEYNR